MKIFSEEQIVDRFIKILFGKNNIDHPYILKFKDDTKNKIHRCSAPVNYLDENFLKFKTQKEVYSKLLELYICDSLLENKYNIIPKPNWKWPDYKVQLEDGSILHIECKIINPTGENFINGLSLSWHIPADAKIPEEKILYSIKEKYYDNFDKDWNPLVDRGIWKKDSLYIALFPDMQVLMETLKLDDWINNWECIKVDLSMTHLLEHIAMWFAGKWCLSIILDKNTKEIKDKKFTDKSTVFNSPLKNEIFKLYPKLNWVFILNSSILNPEEFICILNKGIFIEIKKDKIIKL